MVKKAAKKNSIIPRIGDRAHSAKDDFKTAVILVSLTINVAIFIAWLAIKLSNQYDVQVAQFLFG